MKIKITAILIAIVGCVSFIYNYNRLSKENKLLKNNQKVLLDSNKSYKVRDSLNAVNTELLALKMSELKKYREEDLELINDLKLSKSQLEKIISLKTEAINSLKAALKDSIVRDTVTNQIDTLKCFNYKSVWIDVDGCIRKDSVNLQVKNREKLKAIESLEKKKFWFMKLPIWLFGYKNKQLDIISLNPNTTVTSVEYISVRK